MEMAVSNADLFNTPSRGGAAPSAQIVEIVRTRLHAALELVKSAVAMPWADQLTIIREDNIIRFGKDVLPSDEGVALWAQFNVEKDRPYAVTNEGKDPDPGE